MMNSSCSQRLVAGVRWCGFLSRVARVSFVPSGMEKISTFLSLFFSDSNSYMPASFSSVKQASVDFSMLQLSRSVHLATNVLQPKHQEGVNFQHAVISEKTGSAKGRRVPLKRHSAESIDEVLVDHEAVMQEFADLLHCPVELVQHMVRRDTRLVTHFPKQDVRAKIKLLMSHGFDAQQITARYQLFSRSIDFLKLRLKIIDSVKQYRHHLSLLFLSNIEFEHRIETYKKEVTAMGNHPSQVNFVAHLLGCSEVEITSLVAEGNPHLLSQRPSRLQEIVRILCSHGVSVEEIKRNCHALKCVPDVARSRLQLVHDAGVFDPEKLEAVLLSSETQFQSSLVRWRRCADALGGLADKREMLMLRLHCTERDLDNMLLQAPALKPLSAARLADSLHVLLDVIGIAPSSVVSYPALLFFSTARLLSRWAILQQIDMTEYELIRVLLLPERKFLNNFGSGSTDQK